MRQIVCRQQVRRELDEAGDWYEQERAGLGLEFFAKIERLLHCITGSCAGERFSKQHIQYKVLSPNIKLMREYPDET